MKKTKLCAILGIEYPVIQAPMNWITGVELAAAVSNAGGLGIIGPNAGYRTVTTDAKETGERLREQIRKIKHLTGKPFAVNFQSRQGAEFKESMAFSEVCACVALEEGIPVAMLSGDAPEVYTRRFKSAGMKVVHRPTDCRLEEARKAEAAGVDALIAVGFEAGGHCSVYRIPTFVLVPQIAGALKIPVVAGGGISDARGLAAALALGAQGVFMGTAFIVAKECLAHPDFKNAVLQSNDASTVTWIGLNGSTRALRNAASERCLEMERKGASIGEITNLERSTYRGATLEGDVVNSVALFGAGSGMVKEVRTAAEIVKSLVDGADKILKGLR